MNVWFRGGALAGGALLLAAIHAGAQIREGMPGPAPAQERSGLVERRGHPEVLLHTRGPEFEGGERVVAHLLFKQLDPKAAVGQLHPPAGIDGLIAYPGSRLLVMRGTKEAVTGYRGALEKLDRTADGKLAAGAATSKHRPELVVSGRGKLALRADRVIEEGGVTQAIGGVVITLPGGMELSAQQVRVVREGNRQRIVIEK